MIMLNYAAVLWANKEEESAAVLQAKAQSAYRQATMRDAQTVDVRELEAMSKTPKP